MGAKMQQFLFASAEDADAVTLVTECLNQIGEIPADANLGFVYATDRIADAMRDVLVQLQRRAPRVHWIGTRQGAMINPSPARRNTSIPRPRRQALLTCATIQRSE